MANTSQSNTTSASLNSAPRGADNFLRWSRTAMLRGGRVTKFKGVAASYSPELGLVMPSDGHDLVAGGGFANQTLGMARRLLRWSVAPVALLAAGAPAFAPVHAQAQDECVEGTPGQFVCEDNGDPATSTQVLSPAVSGGDVVVSIEDGFAVDVQGYSGDGITIDYAGEVTIEQSSGSSTITGADYGIDVYQAGSDISITTGGNVTGTRSSGIFASTAQNADPDATITINTTAGTVRGGNDGISVIQNVAGDVEIVTAGVSAGQYSSLLGAIGDAIDVRTASSGSTTIDSTAGSLVGAAEGIYVQNNQGGSVSITTSDVTGQYDSGVRINSNGGDIVIDSSAGFIRGGEHGILIRQDGNGDVTITTGDVDGEDGNGIEVEKNAAAGEIVIDTTAGDVNAFQFGVFVDQDGPGDITITTGNVTTDVNTGIRVSGSGGNIALDTAAGTVDGSEGGITVFNNGATGDISVTTADVVSTSFDTDALYVSQGGGNVSVDTSAGQVNGAAGGVEVRNRGTGDTTITTGGVTSSRGDGIEAVNSADAGDLTTHTSAAAVQGATSGIIATNNGTGNTTIATAAVTSETGFAIEVTNAASAGNLIIDSTAGSVVSGPSSYNDAIRVANSGTGVTRITTADVTSGDGSGEGGNGIDVYAGANTTGLEIDTSAGTVSGDSTGIRVGKFGGGDTSIVTADVVGNFGAGIDVYNGEGGQGALSIDTSAGAVSATGGDGIVIENVTADNVSITTADITATASGSGEGGDGINLDHDFREAQTVAIDTTSGIVTASNYGVNVASLGHDALSITTADVTSERDGVRVIASGSDAKDIVIDTTAGAVASLNAAGIFVRNEGSGDVTITTADASGRELNTIGGGYGIFADSEAGSITINSVAGAVSGGDGGIFARVDGGNGISITTADVTSSGRNGIEATLFNSDGDLVIDTTAGVVSADDNGVFARNDGTGSTTITTGDVDGGDEDGINVEHSGDGDLTIDSTAGSVKGGEDGIDARNYGTGSTTITTANVIGENGDGIYAFNDSGTTDLTINTVAGEVSGSSFGIDARHYGNGAVSITTGDVNGGSSDGIYALTDFNSSGITIDTSAGAVTGGDDGVEVYHYGYGDLSITTADVSGNDDDGIRGRSTYGDVIINSVAGTVTGSDDGISASQYNGEGGAYGISITTASVTGTSGDGISADNEYGSGSIAIDSTAGTVVGGNRGISTINRGYDAATSVTTSDVTGQSGAGIFADEYGEEGYGAGDIMIDSTGGLVTGATDGINASNRAFGNLSITTADVTGESGDGILASNIHASTGSLTIDSSAGTVSGDSYGIFARNNGSLDTNIVTGDVSGDTGDGINAQSETISANFLIDTTAGSVSGGENGIDADNRGTGALTITTGDVTGVGNFGITVDNEGTDLLIDTTAGTILGGNEGIDADNNGTGSLVIVTANVVGNVDEGIQAFNDGAGLSIDSSLGTVSGQGGGIYATNANAVGDNVSIDALSMITADVIGYGEDGIDARNFGTDLTIDSSAGTVSSEREVSDAAPGVGSGFGIAAQNYGTGILSITTADVSSVSIDAIYAANQGTDLIIDSTAGSVSGASNGIRGVNNGMGSTVVKAANSTGASGDGVSMVTGAGTTTLDIDTSAGTVTGGSRGVFVDHQGSDDLTIRVGNVIGEGAEGIFASTAQTGADIFVSGGEALPSNVIGATDGIALTTQGANITVTGLDSVTGQGGNGLNLVSNGGNIAVSDIGTITALGGSGILAISDSGDITIDNVGFDGGITAVGGIGIAAYADNGGTVTIGTSGPVSGEAYGVIGGSYNGSGNVTIDTTNYAVNAAIGIRAVNYGDGSTSVTTADVTGTGGQGVYAATYGTDVTVDTTAGTVTGLTDGIATSNSGTGSSAITTADVNATVGDGVNGFNDDSATDLVINTVAGDVTGGDDGIDARNDGSGQLVITTGDVSGLGDDAIEARNYGTDLVIDTSAGALVGEIGGITAVNNGTGAQTIVTGDVTANIGSAIYSFSRGTDFTVDTSGGTITGGQRGVNARLVGTGVLSITAADVEGGQFNAISAENDGTDIVIDTTAGSISSDSVALRAINAGSGTIDIVTGNVTSRSSSGLFVRGNGTDISVDTSAGTVSGEQNGVYLRQNGAGATAIATADVTGTSRDGIDAEIFGSDATDLIVDTTAGAVTGGGNGVRARNNGSGVLSVTTGDVTAISDTGIRAFGAGTDTTLDTSAGSVTGATNAIRVVNQGTGQTVVSTANVTAQNGDGISVLSRSSAGGLSVNSVAGAVSGSARGIFVDQQSDAELALVVGEVTGSTGIVTQATTGPTSITLSSTAIVTGTEGFGIDARSNGGPIKVEGSSGEVTGTTDGIYVRSSGGDISVANIDRVEGFAGNGLDLGSAGGDISIADMNAVTGVNGNGILANAGGGDIVIGGDGAISGLEAGIAANTSGEGTISLDLAGDTSGTANGVSVSTERGAVAITNSGSLTGGDFAVSASTTDTGPISLVNNGILGNAISFAGADDSFANTSVFEASGNSDFGDGFDTLGNTGTVSVVGFANFRRLEHLTNSGLITLADGLVGGSFATSGDFVGSGGVVELDVDFANGVSDTLTIGGAATGQTLLALNVVNANATLADEVVIVNAGEGTAADAFAISAQRQGISPFLSFRLDFDAANNDFIVGLSLEPRVFEAGKLAESAHSLWYRSADAWSSHRANTRFSEGETSPLWGVLFGVQSDRDESFADPTGLAIGDAVLDYSQDFFGFQTGAEFGIGENLTAGITGGYLNSQFGIDQNPLRANYDVLNIGASLSFESGGLFAEVLAKYDTISGGVQDSTVGGLNSDFDGDAFGGRIELGYRIEGKSVYAEPLVTLEYQETSLDSVSGARAQFSFDGFDGLRGSAGLRIGGESEMGSMGSMIGYYLDASVVREFEGEGITRATFASDQVQFANKAIDTYANVQAGITLEGAGPVSGFFQVESDISDDYSSFGGKVGLKVRF